MKKKEHMNKIWFEPIGIIHSPYKEPSNIPRQPYEGKNTDATIEIFPEFIEGLEGLEKYRHIALLFNFHRSKGYNLKVIPYKKNKLRGIFSTRAPTRPNAIGMSLVKLNSISNNILSISHVDMIDGTPLLDIKPFIKDMDCFDMNFKTIKMFKGRNGKN